jgi:hypothetical protein
MKFQIHMRSSGTIMPFGDLNRVEQWAREVLTEAGLPSGDFRPQNALDHHPAFYAWHREQPTHSDKELFAAQVLDQIAHLNAAEAQGDIGLIKLCALRLGRKMMDLEYHERFGWRGKAHKTQALYNAIRDSEIREAAEAIRHDHPEWLDSHVIRELRKCDLHHGLSERTLRKIIR